uniref:Uncharacterized protein n=1 Tax=Lactuca sativa TaxID=4236 RepID=A0A9R1VML5_LACSA|nr:hypothetical protein LSAT_V11C500267790 [Lactuca sativa]
MLHNCISQTLLSPFVDEYERKDWQGKENKDFFDFKEILGRIRRTLTNDCRTWLDQCRRLCFHVVRYNIMSSDSVKSVNALSRDAQRLPITMLLDFFQAKMQQWWC